MSFLRLSKILSYKNLFKHIAILFLLTHTALNAVLFIDTEEYPASLYLDLFFTFPEQVSFFNFSSIMDKKLTSEKNKNLACLNVSLEFLKKIESEPAKNFFDACKKIVSGYKNIVIFMPKLESNKRISLLKLLLSKIVGKIDETLIKAQNEDYSEYSAAIATSLRIGLTNQKEAKISSPILHSFTIKKSNYFVVKNEILTLTSLHENMQITPVMKSDFNLMRNAWYEDFVKKIFGKDAKIMPKISTPPTNYNKDLTAWLDLDLKNKSENGEVVEKLLKCKIDNAWITPSVCDYFATNGRYKKKDDDYVDALKSFNKKLSDAAGKGDVVPKISLTFEIANNLDPKEKIKNNNVDALGNAFNDQPNPLDKVFWSEQIIDPLKKLFSQIKNEVKISAIVIDLEMYQRRTSSFFSSLSGFNKESIEMFLKSSKLKKLDGSYQKFFIYLEQQAQEVGAWILDETKKINPDIAIHIYQPFFINNWFYRGFFRGICNGGAIDFYSFCSHVNFNTSELINASIILKNKEAFMLSKLNLSSWKVLAQEIKERNNFGCWINRFSRLKDKYAPGEWFELEQTSLPKNGIELCNYLKNNQKK